MKNIYLIYKSLRPEQWIKNLFIFAGILFSQNFFNLALLLKVVLAFFTFCLLSGAVYILNDLVDLECDRRNDARSRRPMASGRLKPSFAVLSLVILIPLLLGLSYCLGIYFFLVALIYFLVQLSYSFYLKHIVILDVFAIAFGFVLRVIAGAVVISVEFSSWLLICTFLLALFLGLSKRRHELVIAGEKAQTDRKVLGEYSSYLLDQMISVVTASTVIAYIFYTVSPETITKFGTKNLIYTIPFVLYGIFRYLYLIHQKEKGGNPERILVTDKPLIINILLWVIAVGVILYICPNICPKNI